MGKYLDYCKKRGIEPSEKALNRYLALVELGLIK